MKVRVTVGGTLERRFGGWIGGSIMGCLGSFQQLWVSKAEWAEHGESVLQKRCP
jgi:actin-like protein 6B